MGDSRWGRANVLKTLQGEKRVAYLPILYPDSWGKWGGMGGAKLWAWGA